MTDRNEVLFDNSLETLNEELEEDSSHIRLGLRQLIAAVENLDSRLQKLEEEEDNQ